MSIQEATGHRERGGAAGWARIGDLRPLHRGLAVAAVQVALCASVGAKYWLDRAVYPRAWFETRAFDPDLPIRGRYIRISAVAQAAEPAAMPPLAVPSRVRLSVKDGRLFAAADEGSALQARPTTCTGGGPCWQLVEPLAYFLPEHRGDPSRRSPGEQLWVEATIPPAGPPRPLRLGVNAGGTVTAIDAP